MPLLLHSSTRRALLGTIGVVAVFAGGFTTGKYFAHHELQLVRRSESLNRADRHDQKRTHAESGTTNSPAETVKASRGAVCFIVSSYTISPAKKQRSLETHQRVLATGFLLRGGIVVSNRHVLEPWMDDPDAIRKISKGGIARRERLMAYFPDLKAPVRLTSVESARDADVAIARADLPQNTIIPSLRLAQTSSTAGDPVVVMGYPLGVTTMVAKSTPIPYALAALSQDDRAIEHLARFKLIRPSATQGHLSDVNGKTLFYDANTARGSSGGPVFNQRGEVIGINAALINGFPGTSLGISVETLQALLKAYDDHVASTPIQNGKSSNGERLNPKR